MTYKNILKKFKDKKILILGDIILDHFIWGSVDRISPEAPVPVVDVQNESYMLGGAGNVANNIISLGAKASIVGVIGNDHRADIINKIFAERKINVEGVMHDSRPTTVKTRVIAHSQQVVRVDREDRKTIGSRVFKSIADYISDNINDHEGVIVSDYNKGVVSQKLMRFLMNLSKQYNLFVAVDPKVGNFNYYKGVSLITPNKKEASEDSRINIKDDATLKNAGFQLLNKLQCDSVLITRGDEGMSLFVNKEVHNIPTVAREVYDVTGAGDTVISAFTLSYVSGASKLQSAEIANHAAGIVVGEVGTATTTVNEILKSLNNT